MGLGNRAGVILLYLVFYMPINVLLYSGYLKNIPIALEEAADIDGASNLDDLLESGLSNDDANACNSCNPDSSWNLE